MQQKYLSLTQAQLPKLRVVLKNSNNNGCSQDQINIVKQVLSVAGNAAGTADNLLNPCNPLVNNQAGSAAKLPLCSSLTGQAATRKRSQRNSRRSVTAMRTLSIHRRTPSKPKLTKLGLGLSTPKLGLDASGVTRRPQTPKLKVTLDLEDVTPTSSTSQHNSLKLDESHSPTIAVPHPMVKAKPPSRESDVAGIIKASPRLQALDLPWPPKSQPKSPTSPLAYLDISKPVKAVENEVKAVENKAKAVENKAKIDPDILFPVKDPSKKPSRKIIPPAHLDLAVPPRLAGPSSSRLDALDLHRSKKVQVVDEEGNLFSPQR